MPIDISTQKVKFLMGNLNTLNTGNSSPAIVPGQVYFAIDKNNTHAELYMDIKTEDATTKRIDITSPARKTKNPIYFQTNLGTSEQGILSSLDEGNIITVGVNGVLPIKNGGTGNTTFSNNYLTYAIYEENGTKKLVSAKTSDNTAGLTYTTAGLKIVGAKMGVSWDNFNLLQNESGILELKKDSDKILSFNANNVDVFGKNFITYSLNDIDGIKKVAVTADTFIGDLTGDISGNAAGTANKAIYPSGVIVPNAGQSNYTLSNGVTSIYKDGEYTLKYTQFKNTSDSDFSQLVTTIGDFAPLDNNQIIPLKYIPRGAQERLVTVDDVGELFKILQSTSDIKAEPGDTIRIKDGTMYYIRELVPSGTTFTENNIQLLINGGYIAEYTAGTASNVSWTNITGRPEELVQKIEAGDKSLDSTEGPTIIYYPIGSDGKVVASTTSVRINALSLTKGGTVAGATTFSSTLGVTGATTLSSTLGVTGATTLSSTLGVTGATTLSSTLGVTGAATFATSGTFGGQLRTNLNINSKYSSDNDPSLVVKGGAAITQQLSAGKVEIDNGSTTKGCILEFDNTNEILKFVFK